MPESADITAEDARFAAQVEGDVGVERIADVYAAALLGATENAGQTETVLEELDALIDQAFKEHFPKLEAILASPLVSHREKSEIIDHILAGRVSGLFLDFLKVVARHGRIDLVRPIRRQARLRYDRLRGRVPVRITTATPLDDAQAGQLAQKLRELLCGEPLLERVVDPGLIGGAVLRVGDVVYDGSIANQLHTIRQQMIDRSVHEIQSRRDRFRNSAGN
jgi:F-type H+-transporting ATPase subunit delta